jgi:hypothetical protein
VTDDWSPADPDSPRVIYDLSGWSFDHQAELAAQLAEAEVPHSWEGTDLIVPEDHEAAADGVIAEVEHRLGIESDDPDGETRMGAAGEVHDQVPLEEGRLVTEYELDEWDDAELAAVTRALLVQRRPFAWQGTTLVVHADDEDVVDSILDMVENGEVGEADDDGERPAFETLTTFFLMADRLRRNPLDADGLEHLLDAIDIAEPSRPPYGVDPRLWQRTCELADELAGALADGDEPDGDEAKELADELHELLRPYI